MWKMDEMGNRSSRRNNKFKLFRNESSYQADEVDQLLYGLHKMEVASRHAIKFSEAQLRGIEAMYSWAKRSRNSALDDVMQQTAQLFQMYADKQRQFVKDHNHFVGHLKKIADIEGRVKEYEKHIIKKEERVQKVRNQITGSSFLWKKSAAEMAALRRVEEEAVIDLEKTKRRLQGALEEAEVLKMFIFRQGMMGIADSYRRLNEHSKTIFGCQREITEMVPAVATQNINQMSYETCYTRDRVAEVRREISRNRISLNYNPPVREMGEASTSRIQPGTPPPPYSEVTPRPGFAASAFSDSQLRPLSQGIRTPMTRSITTGTCASPRVPSAPEETPARIRIPQRLYPDLTSELRIIT